MRELTGRLLRKAGWKVIEARTAASRCSASPSSTPDLIILDLMMPEMDGFEFIDALRARPGWHAIPIVVVTAKDVTDEDRQRLNGSVGQVLRRRRIAGRSCSLPSRQVKCAPAFSVQTVA